MNTNMSMTAAKCNDNDVKESPLAALRKEQRAKWLASPGVTVDQQPVVSPVPGKNFSGKVYSLSNTSVDQSRKESLAQFRREANRGKAYSLSKTYEGTIDYRMEKKEVEEEKVFDGKAHSLSETYKDAFDYEAAAKAAKEEELCEMCDFTAEKHDNYVLAAQIREAQAKKAAKDAFKTKIFTGKAYSLTASDVKSV